MGGEALRRSFSKVGVWVVLLITSASCSTDLMGCQNGPIVQLDTNGLGAENGEEGGTFLGPALHVDLNRSGMVFSTYLGGSGDDDPLAIEMDTDGNVFVVGATQSDDFPKIDGCYDPDGHLIRNDSYDGFIAKLAPDGTTLLAFTYLGGTGYDICTDVEILDTGEILVLGRSNSTDFPMPDDAYQKYVKGENDLFLARLPQNLSKINYATFLGGSGSDVSESIDIGGDGSVWLSGHTDSLDLCVTVGAHQASKSGLPSVEDAFVVRLDPDLRNVTYCTYIGGRMREWVAKGTLDARGNYYMAGFTESTDFPVTPGAYNTSLASSTKGFISKFGPTGDLLASTFFGGSRYDAIADVHLSSDGRVFVTGQTTSPDFPLTHDGANPKRITPDAFADAFLNVLDPDLSTVIYGTVLGSRDLDGGTSVRYDETSNSVYFLGVTNSHSLLNLTRGSFSNEYAGGVQDVFVAKVNLTNGSIEYCSYIGGSGQDLQVNVGSLLEVDERGHMFMTLSTDSKDFPVTRNANMSNHAKHVDGIVLRLNPEAFGRADAPDVNRTHGDGYVNLNWNLAEYDYCRINEVRVFKDLTPTPPGNLVKGVEPPTDFYNDTFGLVNGEKYYYWVAAINSFGVGARTGPIEGYPLGVPTAPLGLRGASGDGAVHLSWNPPSDEGGEPLVYQVHRGTSAENMSLLNGSVLPSNLSYIDASDLDLGLTYFYKVRANNSRYNGTFSEIINVTTWKPPSTPGEFEAVLDNASIRLTWSPPDTNGGLQLIGYNLSRSLNGLVWSRVEAVLSSSDLAFNDTGRSFGQEYYYKLVAYHGEGESQPVFTGPVVPYTTPQAPTDLEASFDVETILLNWSRPVFDGGRDILDYHVYRSTSADYGSMDLIDTVVAPRTSTQDTEVLLNVTYYYAVRARNLAGLGEWSDVVSEKALGQPGTPTELVITWKRSGVQLSWKAPTDTGGHSPLRYHIWRFAGEASPTEIDRDVGSTEYVDETVVPKTRYTYYVVANNIRHLSGPSEFRTIDYTSVPGVVRNPRAVQKVQTVEIRWDAPVSDGGKNITLYEVTWFVRGTPGDSTIVELFNTWVVHEELTPGRTYVYRVRAKNDNGYGDYSEEKEVKFCGLPPAPTILGHGREEDGSVRLTWSWTPGNDCDNCTGYIVERGDSLTTFQLLTEVGLFTEYIDETAQEGETYYYRIIAKTNYGNSEASTPERVSGDGEPGRDLLPWLVLLLVLVLLGLAAALYARGRRVPDVVEGPPPPWRAPAADVSVAAAAPSGTEGILPYITEEVFLVYRDGRLIASCAREECGTPDADLMSGMLIAIQGLIQDGLESGGTLESIKYGENLISIATGEHVVLAAVVYGRPDEEFQDVLRTALASIEGTYSGIIEQWTGDPSELAGVDGLMMPLVDRTAYLTREDVGDVLADHGVALLSAVDFHRGYVRLKMAAVNATEETIIDSALEVHYDGDMLRLERVEPDSIVVRGDRIRLGNVKPGERKTVALLFDPQICQTTHLDGHISYYDSRGELMYVEMKRRLADVVCPVFFTRENANTAMLRRLMRDKLHLSDLRVYRYPRSLGPEEVLAIGKKALGSDEIQLVREYIVRSPTFEAEVWYYAETKVKGYQFVIRLGVDEEKGVLELFAASTAMQPITGLLAEYRRELERIFAETYADEERIRLERDEGLRRTMERRTLHLDSEVADEVADDGHT